MSISTPSPLHRAIQKVATGPAYSKDLNFDEAYAAMSYILSGEADDVQTSIFFIAIRMKRETDEENRGILQAINDIAPRIEVAIDNLIDLSDPYDGYIRGIPSSPFLPAVLSACGWNTLSHGIKKLGPKHGVTHHNILQAAGKNPLLSLDQIKASLESDCGWSYVDQSIYNPVLHAMQPLRKRIIKRQILTTVEVLAQPFRATGQTHLATGYVHKAYPPIYASLARQAKFDSMILIRGVEGGIVPSLKQPGRFFSYAEMGKETMTETSPMDLGIEQAFRNNPLPDTLKNIEKNKNSDDIITLANEAAKQGIAMLNGEAGAARDSVVYCGSIILSQTAKISMTEAAERLRNAIASGKALEKFKQHPSLLI